MATQTDLTHFDNLPNTTSEELGNLSEGKTTKIYSILLYTVEKFKDFSPFCFYVKINYGRFTAARTNILNFRMLLILMSFRKFSGLKVSGWRKKGLRP